MTDRSRKIRRLKTALAQATPWAAVTPAPEGSAPGQDLTARSFGLDDLAQGPRLKALLEAGYLTAASDGQLSGKEVAHIANALADLTEGQLTGQDLDRLLDEFAHALTRDGLEERARQIAKVLGDGDARRGALVVSAGIAAIDAGVAPVERRTFDQLARAFGVPEAEAGALLERVLRELAEAELA